MYLLTTKTFQRFEKPSVPGKKRKSNGNQRQRWTLMNTGRSVQHDCTQWCDEREIQPSGVFALKMWKLCSFCFENEAEYQFSKIDRCRWDAAVSNWGSGRVSVFMILLPAHEMTVQWTIGLLRCIQRQWLTWLLVLRICENQLMTPCIHSLQVRQVPSVSNGVSGESTEYGIGFWRLLWEPIGISDGDSPRSVCINYVMFNLSILRVLAMTWDNNTVIALRWFARDWKGESFNVNDSIWRSTIARLFIGQWRFYR
jgi:hypothetical protein